MNLKRVAAIALGSGALAVWLSDAMTPVSRAPLAVGRVAQPVIDARGADLAHEMERLRERLKPGAPPSDPSRNLFEFSRPRGAATRRAVAPPEPVPVAPAAVPPVPLTLAGIAEDAGAAGPERTAIISGSGQLFLVKEGDGVTPRYKVAKIAADGVDLEDVTDGARRHLALK